MYLQTVEESWNYPSSTDFLNYDSLSFKQLEMREELCPSVMSFLTFQVEC